MPWIAGVVVLYLAIAILILQTCRTFQPSVDLENDTRNAVELIHHGLIPKHGSVATYCVLNAPGITYGLAPGLLMFPTEPVLAEHVDNLLLFALTLAGLFALVAKRFGNPAAFYCCAFYMLSVSGIYFADSMRPRAHPVFLVWMLFFLDRWIAEKSPKALGVAVFIYIIANFWLLEFLPALVLFPLAWVVYRPKFSKLSLLVALLAGLLVWSPYLLFEARCDFHDLRYLFGRVYAINDWKAAYNKLLTNPDLVLIEKGERVHDLRGGPLPGTIIQTNKPEAPAREPKYEMVNDSRAGMCLKATEEVTFHEYRGWWICPKGTEDWWFMADDGIHWFNSANGWVPMGPANRKWAKNPVYIAYRAIQRVCSAPRDLWLAPFPKCVGTIGQWVLCALTICGALWLAISALLARWKISSRFFAWTAIEEKARVCLTLCCLGGVVPAVMLAFLVNPIEVDLGRRDLWLWVAIAPFLVLFLRQALKKLGPVTVHLATLGLILMTAWNPFVAWKIQTLIANGFHAAPANGFNQVIDQIGAQAKKEGRTSLAIGYDMPFHTWLIFGRIADGASKVGGDFDLVFLIRHGLTNTDNRCEGVSPDDEFRIVEKRFDDPARRAVFDLSRFPRMDVFFETPDYLILRRPQK